MDDLRSAWKQAGKSLVLAINDLGVSLYKTAQAGVNAAVEWAKTDNVHVPADGYEVHTYEQTDPVDPAEEPAAEEPEGEEESAPSDEQ